MTEPAHPRIGVVLPGGGARGAYQVGVLRAVAEMCPPGTGPFAVITGTSAGSVNAAVLASHAGDLGHAVARLEHFWSDLHCADIYRTDPWTVLSSALRWGVSLGSGGFFPVAPRALLDNTPLRELLQRSLKTEGIDASLKANDLDGVAITASAYTRARAVSFFQGQPSLGPWERSRRSGEEARLSVDHIMASVALPMLFPAQCIGNEFYGDGGMRMSAPLSPAIHLGADRLLVIATRDEKPDPAPVRRTPYPSAGEIGGYLLDTIFMDSLNSDLARLERINRTLALLPKAQQEDSLLKPIRAVVIRPSRDLRDVTAEHAASMPGSVKLLLKTLGGWGRDWRMASYLLFEGAYCRELIRMGYADGLQQADNIREMLGPSGKTDP